MIEKEIRVRSYWGVEIKNEYIAQEKDILMVLLPGGKYTNMAPLFYYSYNISLQLGYDILALDYGFQKTYKAVKFDDVTFYNMTQETIEAIKKCLEHKKYKIIVFIGKCVGTVVQHNLVNEFKEYEQKHIFMTPWTSIIEGIKNTSSLVIVGTNDPVFKQEHISNISNMQNVKVKLIEGANHDLEKDDFLESLAILKDVSESIYDFLKELR